MEHKIGEIFEYNGEWYQCVTGQSGEKCIGCSFKFSSICIYFHCLESERKDHTKVIFKKLEKVGEPYEHCGKSYQCYKLPMEIEIRLLPNNCNPIGKDNLVEIEIKQNKEDMEEYKMYDAKEDIPEFDKVVDECLFGEDKLNLKPFDLQQAKDGKPVCTRDGRKARIICFDYKGDHNAYPLLVLISTSNLSGVPSETIAKYTEDGRYAKYNNIENDEDLMMLPEKKEGWINVKKDAGLFKSKEEAERNCTKDYATVRVEFEI